MRTLTFAPVTTTTSDHEIYDEITLIYKLGPGALIDYADLNLPHYVRDHGRLAELHQALVLGQGELGGYYKERVLEQIARWRRTPDEQREHDQLAATLKAVAASHDNAEGRRAARILSAVI